MNKNLSVKRIYIGVGCSFVFITLIFLITIFIYTESLMIRGAVILFSFLILLLGLTLIGLLRRKLLTFSQLLNTCIDDIINGNDSIQFDLESETLTGKFNYKLKRLYEIMNNSKQQLSKEKQAIQETISDISHQVKTPITNLKIYNSTLVEHQLPYEKQQEFLTRIETQIDKLDFLMQALVKTSRLEADIITLSIHPAPLYDTIGLALSGIVLPAEKKKIEVDITCNASIVVPHDTKWTAEALFNILENAVKYTSSGGNITVVAEQWEMTTKIDISDTGKGISEQHMAQIFKRFYREEDVKHIDGIGIGLYLSQEIITKQGGYIQVTSTVNKGSTFSVFLPNKGQH